MSELQQRMQMAIIHEVVDHCLVVDPPMTQEQFAEEIRQLIEFLKHSTSIKGAELICQQMKESRS